MLTVKQSQKKFIKLLALFIAIITPWVLGVVYVNSMDEEDFEGEIKLVNYKVDTISKVDHNQFEILQQKFTSPKQITEACLSCHNKTDQEVMMTSHWKWAKSYVKDNGDTIQLGKKNILNNFCIGTESNELLCSSCHIGYGWDNMTEDFNKSKDIDCIVCHDQSGEYKKAMGLAGLPTKTKLVICGMKSFPFNYDKVLTSIGKPQRHNCGACHFVGGGGNNVKHGDLEMALNNTTKKVDVHMGVDGANMNCIECHKTERHNIKGNLYSIASEDNNRISCEECHTAKPHENSILNNHIDRIACQTCHIPEYAKVNPTKMYWDWSTAGKHTADGGILMEKDSTGAMTYHTKKGNFKWGTNVTPDYVWFNGKARHYVMGDKIDTTKVVHLNTLLGSYTDKKSKIIPVKTFTGKQIYDAENNYMIVPHLFGKDTTSYWLNFDWNKAAITGMKRAGMPYSGKYSFVATQMDWPLNHMVAPSEEALRCIDCHTSSNGRLATLTDFYLPRRDSNSLLDKLGFILIILTFIGVAVHGSLRIIKK